MEADRSEEARGHKSDRHVSGESDRSTVPQKPANNDSGPLPAESVEGRGLTKEHVEQWLLDRTERRVSRSRGLLGLRAAAGLRRAGWSAMTGPRDNHFLNGRKRVEAHEWADRCKPCSEICCTTF